MEVTFYMLIGPPPPPPLASSSPALSFAESLFVDNAPRMHYRAGSGQHYFLTVRYCQKANAPTTTPTQMHSGASGVQTRPQTYLTWPST